MLVAGASGHALEVLDVLLTNYKDNIFFFDEINKDKDKLLNNYLVYHTFDELKNLFKVNNKFCLGVGAPKLREYFSKELTNIGGVQIGIRARSCTLSENSLNIAPSVDILHYAFISAEVIISESTLINTGANVHHECKIGKFCEISPGVKLLGNVSLGDYCRIGSNAVILPGINIVDEVVIGAGAIVDKNIDLPGTYVGVPAKLIKK